MKQVGLVSSLGVCLLLALAASSGHFVPGGDSQEAELVVRKISIRDSSGRDRIVMGVHPVEDGEEVASIEIRGVHGGVVSVGVLSTELGDSALIGLDSGVQNAIGLSADYDGAAVELEGHDRSVELLNDQRRYGLAVSMPGQGRAVVGTYGSPLSDETSQRLGLHLRGEKNERLDVTVVEDGGGGSIEFFGRAGERIHRLPD